MKNTILTMIAAVALPMAVMAQSSDMIGGMSRAEFDRKNAEGNSKVASIKPTETKLSDADQKLMMEVAMGGMMQLTVSQAAAERLKNEDAMYLAKSEIEEQSGVGNKLKEIAAAKGIEMPEEESPETKAMLDKMTGMNGEELDMFYVRESGVKGHQKLMATMKKVQSQAKAPELKALAAATMPVIIMHMNVSQKTLSMGKAGDMKSDKKTGMK